MKTRISETILCPKCKEGVLLYKNYHEDVDNFVDHFYGRCPKCHTDICGSVKIKIEFSLKADATLLEN